MSNQNEIEIDSKTKRSAAEELKEDPSQVNNHIESLRRLVQSMPHLQCPTDAQFLLRFLRVSRFDLGQAQKRLDNFCTVRTSWRGFPDYFKLYSVDHSLIDGFLRIRYFIPLGRVDSGEEVLLLRFEDWDPEALSLIRLINLFNMSLDVLMSQEGCQTHGLKIIYDFYGGSSKNLEAVCDPAMLKAAYVSFQDAYPMRLKSQIFYSDSVLLERLSHMSMFFFNEKMKKRASWLRNDISEIIEMVPGLERILPTEYRGLGGSLDHCAERWNERFKVFYANGHPFQSIHVDETKRPEETLDYLPNYDDYKGTIDEVKRSSPAS